MWTDLKEPKNGCTSSFCHLIIPFLILLSCLIIFLVVSIFMGNWAYFVLNYYKDRFHFWIKFWHVSSFYFQFDKQKVTIFFLLLHYWEPPWFFLNLKTNTGSESYFWHYEIPKHMKTTRGTFDAKNCACMFWILNLDPF